MRCRAATVILMLLLNAASACNKRSGSHSNPVNNPPDSIRTVKTGLNFPWEILWGSDGTIWMTERGGRISRIDPSSGNTLFSFQINEVVSNNEGGLLGMVLHPDFLANGLFYVVYDYNDNGTYRGKVVRYTFKNNLLSNPFIILDKIPAASIHNGSRLWITADNKLMISTGDASISSNAQITSSLSGKILRVNLDGSIPADNPIPNNPVWSFGHRNPQGMVMVGNILYASEHGPDIEDEVNIIEKGRNYGWPDVKGPCDGSEQSFCDLHHVKPPIWSSGSSTVATCGMDYYNNNLIGDWKNSLLLCTLKDATLYQLKLSADGLSVEAVHPFYRGTWGRLRDICISPDGKVYICTSNGGNSDRIVEIQ